MHEPDELKKIEAERGRWERETLDPALKEAPERGGPFTTVSGKPIQRIYTPADVPDLNPRRDLGFPGEYPFTRGVYPTMYRGRLWTMRMYSGYGSAEETNRRYKFLLGQGQTGLSVAFHLPTLMGYDSDHPMAAGEGGKAGAAIASLEDMEVLLEGLPLGEVTPSMTITSTAAVAWAMYIAVCEGMGIPYDRIGGTTQNDILKEYIAQKAYIFPIRPSLRLVTDTIVFGSRHLPRWNTISISGYPIREAGGPAPPEGGFTNPAGV